MDSIVTSYTFSSWMNLQHFGNGTWITYSNRHLLQLNILWVIHDRPAFSSIRGQAPFWHRLTGEVVLFGCARDSFLCLSICLHSLPYSCRNQSVCRFQRFPVPYSRRYQDQQLAIGPGKIIPNIRGSILEYGLVLSLSTHTVFLHSRRSVVCLRVSIHPAYILRFSCCEIWIGDTYGPF